MSDAFLFLCDVPGVSKSSRPEGRIPPAAAVPRTRPCLAVRGDPFTIRPRVHRPAGSKPVVQEFLLDSWIYEWEYWVPPWLLCEACWALPMGRLVLASQQFPPSPMGVAVGFPKKRD